jgi:hypothetical protein
MAHLLSRYGRKSDGFYADCRVARVEAATGEETASGCRANAKSAELNFVNLAAKIGAIVARTNKHLTADEHSAAIINDWICVCGRLDCDLLASGYAGNIVGNDEMKAFAVFDWVIKN